MACELARALQEKLLRQEFEDALPYRLRVEALLDEGIGASLLGFLANFWVAGNHDDGNLDFLRAKSPDQFGASHLSHTVVCDQDVGSRGIDVSECVFGIGERRDAAVWVEFLNHPLQQE